MGVPISSLPAASDLTGAELIPVVQSGQTKRTTTDAIPYVPAGTGAVTTTVQNKLREFVSVRDFGAVGDGVADDTVAVQAAITAAAGKTLFVDGGIFLCGPLTATSSFSVLGAGTIRRKSSTAGVLLTLGGTSTSYDIAGITLDGNQAQQTPLDTQHTVSFTAVGTASAQASLELHGVTFLNGNGADVDVSDGSDRDASNEYLGVHGCRFLAGREGVSVLDDTRCINIKSPVSYIINGCIFDFMGTPTIGRAGIVCFDGYSGGLNTQKARGVISNNFLQNIGRSQAASTLGAIDIYNNAQSTSITGNTVINPYGRGIQVKADAQNITITGNVVEGLLGAAMSTQIGVNASTTANEFGTVTIQGNSLINSGYDGIVFTGRNTGGTEFTRCISILGNVISNCTRRAINIADTNDITVANNVVQGSDIAIYAGGIKESLVVSGNRISTTSNTAVFIDSTSTTAWMNIQGNHIQSVTGRGIYIDSAAAGQITNNNILSTSSAAIETRNISDSFLVQDNVIGSSVPFNRGGATTGLRIGQNMCQTAPGSSFRTLTIATGVVTVFMDWHIIDTEGAAATDDLDTINGGFDGYIVTFRAANTARDVVFKDGTGNMRLNGDFTMTHSDDTITLRFMSGLWYEMCRSDNAV